MAMDRKISALRVMRQGLAIACGHWAPIIAAEAALPEHHSSVAVVDAGGTAADPVALSAGVNRHSLTRS